MSHYNDFKTTIKDKDCLITAITRCGIKGKTITRDMIKTHDTAVKINGYYNDNRKANVIIRRENFGGYGDMGFLRNEDGSYTIIQDDLDGDQVWRGRLQTYYNIETSKKAYAEKGIPVEEVTDNLGRIQLRAKFQNVKTGSRIQVRR